jgi:hypothetical protein
VGLTRGLEDVFVGLTRGLGEVLEGARGSALAPEGPLEGATTTMTVSTIAAPQAERKG